MIGTLSKISNVSVIDLHEASKGSNGPTVAVLLSPGSGSGPTPLKPFRTAIKAPFLTGPLTGHSLRSLVMAMRSGTIYVLVQTSNGVDPSSAALRLAITPLVRSVARSVRSSGELGSLAKLILFAVGSSRLYWIDESSGVARIRRRGRKRVHAS